MSHFCSSKAEVSEVAPSITFTAEVSKYFPTSFAIKDDVAGEISDGFRTTALPAAIAPTTGSRDKTGKCGQEWLVLILNLPLADIVRFGLSLSGFPSRFLKRVC